MLLFAAEYDCATHTVPDYVPVLILMIGLLEVEFAPALLGLILVPLPFVAAALIKEGSVGGGGIKLMGVCGFVLGVKRGYMALMLGLFTMNNALMVPVLAVGFALLPFYYVKFTASKHKKQINMELETALSMITTSYLRNKNTIIRAIEKNLPYLNPPVSEVFRNFLMEAKLINSNTAEALEGLKKGMDNAVFHEWVDAVIACQDDYNLKNTLPPIVSKLSDMRVVSSELDLLIYEPVKEYITMIILLLGSITLLYFLNKDWYETLMFTGFGKVLLAISETVVFISVAAVSKHIRPIEYKR